MSQETSLEVATFAGGCFWCIETVFREVDGVEQVISGYTGGSTPNPAYQQVCTGQTGHAEAVQVSFNPSKISYREILEIFFSVHDPTTLNRQGADVGTQYRSVIFYHSPEQKQTAESLIRELDESGVWGRPIVTQIVPFEDYYRAEEYHQEYYQKNPFQGYCQAVIAPKVSKFRKKFTARLKT